MQVDHNAPSVSKREQRCPNVLVARCIVRVVSIEVLGVFHSLVVTVLRSSSSNKSPSMTPILASSSWQTVLVCKNLALEPPPEKAGQDATVSTPVTVVVGHAVDRDHGGETLDCWAVTRH